MKNRTKALILIVFALLSIVIGIGVGSVFIPPVSVMRIMGSYFLRMELPEEIDALTYGMITGIRMPRVLMAFLAGAALSLSGTVMQSVLKNPLASSYGLGVSSGAGLGAAIIMISGLAAGRFGNILLPVTGTLFGFISVVAAMGLAYRFDKNLSDHTVILSGMVLSLFLNAVMNMLAAMNAQYTHQILLWQLGAFSGKDWSSIAVVAAITVVCMLIFQGHGRELDIMTFGEEVSLTVGVDLKKERWFLIAVTSFLTGTAVSFVGVVGFVDLIAPHIVRKFFGASHKWVLPTSALFGGGFMVLCDLLGRTAASPREIPAGSITALIGAPFFFYLYFMSRKKR